MSPTHQVGRYLRTTAGLRPVQVATRVRLRTQGAVLHAEPRIGPLVFRDPRLTGTWPAGFRPFDARRTPDRSLCDELDAGRLTLLGHTRVLRLRGAAGPGRPGRWDWHQLDAPLLWRYHLHYWDWAWALVAEGDRGRSAFARLYLSWRAATTVGAPVVWSPYVVSLRAWTLCGLWPRLARGTPAEAAVRTDLGAARSFLRRHVERDVGGNHLLKNLKALLGLAVAAEDDRDRRRWQDALLRELDRQILPDGGHYERSPAYHCQVLADLDDLAGLLTAAVGAAPAALPAAADRMRAWLADVLGPDGELPLLNDGFPLEADTLRLLMSRPGGPPRADPPAGVPVGSRLLADSGLAVLTAGPWHLLADVGPPCPPDLPAHAHADTLTFLAWYRNRPLLVDTGTSTYAAGPTRDCERGSAAHATVVLDGADSTEVWGAFRAGRRARPRLVALRQLDGTITLTASHDGYRHLPGRPVHTRTWRLDATGPRVDDLIDGHGRHRVEVLFPFAAGTTATPVDPPALAVRTAGGERLHLRADGPGRWEVRPAHRAAGWGRTVAATTAAYVLDTELPTRVRTALTHRPPPIHDQERIV